MGFEGLASSEQIGDPLEKCGNNCGISPNWSFFIKGEKEIILLLEGKNNMT